MQFFKSLSKHSVDIFLYLDGVIFKLAHLLSDGLEALFNGFFLFFEGIVIALSAFFCCRVGLCDVNHVVVNFTSARLLDF